MAICEIIKILPVKKSRTEGAYIRVEFLEIGTGHWLKTDLVKSYRNFERWENLLKIGNILERLDEIDENTINADSYPKLFETEEQKLERYAKAGAFG